MRVARGAFVAKQMALDAPDEDVGWVFILENLKMGVEAVAIDSHVEAASLTLRANPYLSALDSGAHGKNSVVRDQSFSLLIYGRLSSGLGNEVLPAGATRGQVVFGLYAAMTRLGRAGLWKSHYASTRRGNEGGMAGVVQRMVGTISPGSRHGAKV